MKATLPTSPRISRPWVIGLVLLATTACSSTAPGQPALALSQAVSASAPSGIPSFALPTAGVAATRIDAGEEGDAGERMHARRKARHEAGWAKQGFYIGVEGVYGIINGDFDGTGGIVDPSGNVILIPKADDSAGYGFRAGYRFETRAFEMGFQLINHDGTFGIYSPDIELLYINLALKQFFLTNSMLQPYIMLGASSIHGEIKDGAYNAGFTTSGKADLSGNSGNVGGGITLIPFPNLMIDFSAIYRVADITEAVGLSTVNLINHDVDISGWMLGVGVTWTL